MKKIGTILKDLRKDLKIKQKDMADKLNVSPAYICLIENNEREISLELLKKYADILSIPLEFLTFQAFEPTNLTEEQLEKFNEIKQQMLEFQNLLKGSGNL